jgi:SAM-dependent methyltransferase
VSGAVGEAFESGFLSSDLETQVRQCDDNELVPLFNDRLPGHQPILEAGSGSGRWVIWFGRRGWSATGLDWSEALTQRARATEPSLRFVAGDMRAMPFSDGEFGAVVALGSVEHDPEGPTAALSEFHRVLRPGGVALITVPHGGRLCRISRRLRDPYERLKQVRWIRRAFGKPLRGHRSHAEARVGTSKPWFPIFSVNRDGWFFYEYRFTGAQMRQFLADAGFAIDHEYVSFGDEGILHNFGRLAARWNRREARVMFTPIGKLLRRVIPVRLMGLHLIYVVRR